MYPIDRPEVVLLKVMTRDAKVWANIIIVNEVRTQPVLAGKIAGIGTEIYPLGVRHPSVLIERVTDHGNQVTLA